MIDDQDDPRCNPTCHSKLDHGQKPRENLGNKKASKSQTREQNQQETHVGNFACIDFAIDVCLQPLHQGGQSSMQEQQSIQLSKNPNLH